MSNFEQFYKHKSDKANQPTHRAIFWDRGRYYIICFRKLGTTTQRANDFSTKEEFEKWLNENEFELIKEKE